MPSPHRIGALLTLSLSATVAAHHWVIENGTKIRSIKIRELESP